MTRKPLLCLSVMIIVLLSSSFVFTDQSSQPKIMKLEDLRPGTAAVGFTVFQGVEPEKFEVLLGEAVSSEGWPFILAKVHGGPVGSSLEVPLEKIGGVRGMSGSPVFVNCSDLESCISQGQLVGALSMITGRDIQGGMNTLITPIEELFGNKIGGRGAVDSYRSYKSKLPQLKVSNSDLKSLLLVSGYSTPNLEKVLQVSSSITPYPNLSSALFNPVQVSQGQSQGSYSLKPGSMISVYLAGGDMPFLVSGTVTWVDGDYITAFGHPLLGSGKVLYPFVQTSVAATIQSSATATKVIGWPVGNQGLITFDSLREILGVIGLKMRPIIYNASVAIDKDVFSLTEYLSPVSPRTHGFLKTLLKDWAGNIFGDTDGLDFSYQIRLYLKDQPEIFVQGTTLSYSSFSRPFDQVNSRLEEVLERLQSSGFDYQLSAVRVDMKAVPLKKIWVKEAAFLSKNKALPGDEVVATIVVSNFPDKGEVKKFNFSFVVPKDIFNGLKDQNSVELNVLVQDGSHLEDNQLNSDLPLTLDKLVSQINRRGQARNNQLYLLEVYSWSPERETEKGATSWEKLDAWTADRKIMKNNGKLVKLVALPLVGDVNDTVDVNVALKIFVFKETGDKVKLQLQSETQEKTKKKKRFWPF